MPNINNLIICLLASSDICEPKLDLYNDDIAKKLRVLRDLNVDIKLNASNLVVPTFACSTGTICRRMVLECFRIFLIIFFLLT